MSETFVPLKRLNFAPILPRSAREIIRFREGCEGSRVSTAFEARSSPSATADPDPYGQRIYGIHRRAAISPGWKIEIIRQGGSPRSRTICAICKARRPNQGSPAGVMPGFFISSWGGRLLRCRKEAAVHPSAIGWRMDFQHLLFSTFSSFAAVTGEAAWYHPRFCP